MRLKKASSLAFLLLFWVLAALVVAIADQRIQPLSPLAAAAIKIAAIVAAGFGYARFCPLRAASHALFVGASWVLLDIVAEMLMTARSGHGWFELIGSPSTPILRTLVLLTWISAAGLFARRQATTR